jgi:hypothetical protein
MSPSRRFFLYGAGALVTSAFAARAAGYARRTGAPLLITPDAFEGELHFYEDGLLSLGPWLPEPEVPAPTWRHYLVEYAGETLASQTDIERVCDLHSLEEEELERRLDSFAWADVWERQAGPAARAYHLLDGLGLGPERMPSRGDGWLKGLTFTEGAHPGDSSLFVTAEDPVVLSLLQGRLIEIGAGLKLVEGQ